MNPKNAAVSDEAPGVAGASWRRTRPTVSIVYSEVWKNGERGTAEREVSSHGKAHRYASG